MLLIQLKTKNWEIVIKKAHKIRHNIRYTQYKYKYKEKGIFTIGFEQNMAADIFDQLISDRGSLGMSKESAIWTAIIPQVLGMDTSEIISFLMVGFNFTSD